MTTTRLILLALSLCASLATYSGQAAAQGGQDGEALFAAGVKAMDAGKYSSAVQQFSRAMRSDSLSTAQIAKALFLRGVAHKNAGKPAQAIADLDSALWLQGLSNKDLAQAYLTRGEAYREVGMDELAAADIRRGREVDPNAKTIAAVRSAPEDSSVGAFTTQVESASEEASSRRSSSRPIRAQLPGFPNVEEERPIRQPAPRRQAEAEPEAKPVPSFQTEVKTAQREPEPKPEPKPIPSFRTSILPDDKPAPTPAPKKAPAAPAQWNTSVSSDEEKESGGARSTVSSFFSGLWGGSDKEDSEASAAEAEPAQPASQPAQAPTTGWSQSTQVASARQATSAPSPAPARTSTASGGASTYRIQLAALRTEQEAQSTWQRLASRHGNLLAGQEHVIEKTTVGSMGTFYRIQIGPFTDKAESARLCESLKSGGVDCFVVAR